VIAVLCIGAAAWTSTPSASDLPTRLDRVLRFYGEERTPAGRVAPIMREAVVATEDERFYSHQGVDLIGVLRAVPYDLTHLSFAQGASTITEQVAKLLYLGGNDHSPWRKLQDAALALKLERHFDKQQILGAYLDATYFGDGAHGVSQASERYFGIPPSRLDLAQASLLAGLIQAPSAYDPLVHPALARARQVDVLRALVDAGFVTEQQGQAALRRPLPLRGGAALPSLAGVDLASGPAFVWWELVAGAAVALAGAVLLIGLRLPGLRPAHRVLVVKAAALGLALVGFIAVARSFRGA
jgi:penicillin-binding protein 1A